MLHPFQKNVKESAAKIDKLIASMNDNNLDLRNDVTTIETQLS